MATLNTQPKRKHSSGFWALTIVAVFLAVLVIGVAVLLSVDPTLKDVLMIEWDILTGHGGGRPQ